MGKEEVWKPISGFEGIYEVSSFGRIKSLRRVEHSKLRGFYRLNERIRTPATNGKGYLGIVLTKNGRHYHYLVHRLVAEAFIPNPDNLPQINHKNENKSDNSFENLEWCTSSYNMHYKDVQERIHSNCGKRVGKYSKDGELLAVYQSLTEAARENGFGLTPISNCFVGRYKTSYGFIWKPI